MKLLFICSGHQSISYDLQMFSSTVQTLFTFMCIDAIVHKWRSEDSQQEAVFPLHLRAMLGSKHLYTEPSHQLFFHFNSVILYTTFVLKIALLTCLFLSIWWVRAYHSACTGEQFSELCFLLPTRWVLGNGLSLSGLALASTFTLQTTFPAQYTRF